MSGPQRSEPRHPIPGQAPGEVTIVQALRLIDISRRGASVDVAVQLAPESLHDFRFFLVDRSVVIKGRIAHCRIGEVEHDRVTYRAGIEFVDPSAHAREAIEAYIARLNDARLTSPS